MGIWALVLSKLSCLCGFNQPDPSGDGSGPLTVKIKVKQSCCNGSTHYNKTVHVMVQDQAMLNQIMKKLDSTLEEISVSSSPGDEVGKFVYV